MMNTIITDNVINAQSAFIKVAMAIGPLAWMEANQGTNNTTKARMYGASFTDNTFISMYNNGSLGTGYFGYGL